jgi:hypothetical protein
LLGAENRGDGFSGMNGSDVRVCCYIPYPIIKAIILKARDAPLQLDQFVEAVDDSSQGGLGMKSCVLNRTIRGKGLSSSNLRSFYFEILNRFLVASLTLPGKRNENESNV